ncbi:hypothetical protein ACN28C_29585 [Plantactinospora sp. WMMC1484]|uniref:hypothetical protein n=1 Tax=Plantactinospora sp. WMMC1484 TaxID=3404122 RepID=UPI003BF50421
MSTINVETAALVRHASGRYGDAMACAGIGRYVRHVGAVPDFAWGSLEWAQKWRTEWAEACDDRVREASLASERFGDVGETLYQVAANYAEADIGVEADLSALAGGPLMPFVDALGAPPSGVARPGGDFQAPDRHTGAVIPSIPDDTPVNHDLNMLLKDGSIIQQDLYPKGADLSKTPKAQLRAELMTEGRRKLWEFITEWYDDLQTAEKLVRQWGVVEGTSSTGLIDEASAAWPGIIANRANLLRLGANAYRTLRENMANQVKDLQQYWASPGAASAYVIYASSLGRYYDAIADNLQWLGDEGVEAAKTIDSLQLSYANVGYSHIGVIATQLQAYNEAAASLSKATGDPLKALGDALTALTDSLIESWKAAANKAGGTLAVSDKVIDRAPHFDNNNHALELPPSGPSNEWRGDGWKPGTRIPTP